MRPITHASQHRVAGLVLTQIISLQLGAAVAKDLFGRAGPTGMASLRIAWTAVVLWVLVRPRLRGLTTRQLSTAAAFGLVVAAMNLSYFHAIARIPLGVAASLELLGPLGLSLVLCRHRTDLQCAGLAVIGLILLALPDSGLNIAGLVSGGMAGVLRAAYVLLNKRIGELFDDWSGLTLAMAVGAAVLIPLAAMTSADTVTRIDILIPGLTVAMLSSLVPYSLDLLALRRITPRLFGILISASPVVALAIGYTALDESLAVHQLLAIGVITAANIAAVRAHRHRAA